AALRRVLTQDNGPAIVTELCQALVKAYGGPVDVAIPAPHPHGGSDERHFHAHILMNTRTATAKGLGAKGRELDQNSTLKKLREKVADRTNVHLERAGLEVRVYHRSHKDRGINIEPTRTEGLAAPKTNAGCEAVEGR
ncbi:MobA/MobL family protein, partial [Acinetobacter baumannii]|uniref:MobA/MobL family protein n=1 Tax=Acinetobacter baumannii TaxID=470 RepID=UPI001C43962D